LISLERFIIDFWRADREIINSFTLFSVAQLSALVLMACSIGGYLFIILHNRRQL
jgi:prolipoprotein diacylglyceryltransferase